MSALKCYIAAALGFASVIAASSIVANADGHWAEPGIPGTSEQALVLGRDLDGDGDPDEITIRLEVIEVTEEVYPGEFVKFWVFAPEGRGMAPVARVPSPTIRVEEGDRVRIILQNTHYFPHTIHPHGTIHPNAMDGCPTSPRPRSSPVSPLATSSPRKTPARSSITATSSPMCTCSWAWPEC